MADTNKVKPNPASRPAVMVVREFVLYCTCANESTHMWGTAEPSRVVCPYCDAEWELHYPLEVTKTPMQLTKELGY